MKPNPRIPVLLLLAVLLCIQAKAQIQIDHVEPPLWWTGMNTHEVMLTVHGTGIAAYTPVLEYPGVSIKTVTKTSNPNYLFINLAIDPSTKAGSLNLKFVGQKKQVLSWPYELRERKAGSANRQSFSSSDVVYLIMPDRFANGDPSNDSMEQLTEKANRGNQDGRHGGDIKGIIDHLDYLKDLGITAIWTTPLLEDNQPVFSYHTYATTDYYQIDGRYGNNADYVKLADECHKRGIKLIMDMVPNHCGSEHWWMKDMPMSDWFHQFPEFTRTNYTIATWNDPHASKSDAMLNSDGWFDNTMPDLNQNNPYVLTYFKQFAIFWLEYAGLDGIRVDTYPYNDKWRIAEWTEAISAEYPNINIVGECWQHRPSEIAYWQTGVKNFDEYDSGLPSVMDFPLNDAFMGWEQGASRFYNVYVMDYLYSDLNQIMVFLDNHDMQRFSEQVRFDINKFKSSVAHLLTTRGIPQIYYGTEIMMGGQKSKGDGDIRRDFPGGWAGDGRNAFTKEGRNDMENEAFEYIRALLKYRNENTVLQNGQMIHFIPRDNVYVYFRLNDQKTVMVILNNSGENRRAEISRFDECLHGSRKGNDIITGEEVSLENLILNPYQTVVLEIK